MLSSSETKTSVWRVYTATCKASGEQAVSYSKFVDLWHQFCPKVVVAKPIYASHVNRTPPSSYGPRTFLSMKRLTVLKHSKSIWTAPRSREFYRKTCTDAATTFSQTDAEKNLNETHKPCSFNCTMHYSFDYAQQVHFPSNPMQPGPIYFKIPRKCGIFGVMCVAVPRQVNYLIDEAGAVGKGANATISYLHHFFARHGIGETDVHLHADNCAGQNKNNYFLWYLAWRIATELHQSIKYSFLIAGHTKFGPDRCFGILKKAYKVSFILSIYELARMVDTSSNTGVKKAQLVTTHDGRVIVPAYDWCTFLGQYFKNIKKFHHFRFSKDEPGVVYCREYLTSPEQAFALLKDGAVIPSVSVLPQKINPQGLSDERRTYLHREIRQFCKPGTEDLVAPVP